jgi:hypothetical protein
MTVGYIDEDDEEEETQVGRRASPRPWTTLHGTTTTNFLTHSGRYGRSVAPEKREVVQGRHQ